jgi:hypothetical protein
MPIIQARETIKSLESVNAESIKNLVILAFNDPKLADSVQNKWLLAETDRQSKRSK